MNQTAALWDMDGTLVDSAEFHFQSWIEALTPEGIHLTREQFRASFGKRNDEIIPGWLGASSTLERVAAIGDAKEVAYRRMVRESGMPPLPGAAEWVKRLRGEGWMQAIASSAPRENVVVVLDVIGLAGCFGAIVSSEDVKRGKPDPQVFETAAAKLGVPRERCVVVEDAASGVEAAHRARMACIGVTHGIADLKADIAVKSLADLPDDAFTRLLGAPAR